MRPGPLLTAALCVVTACTELEVETPDEIEGQSLLGAPLVRPALSAEARAKHEGPRADAEAAYAADPDDVDSLIWWGRRTAYLGQYRDAIEIYGQGIERHPEEPRLYRHRGHRYLSLRRLDEATSDLERAAELIEGRPDEVEPDGLPNARGVPTSTLNSNVYYHLGLVRYLKGNYAGAEEAYQRCIEFSKNPDMLCATAYWLYLTRTRLGDETGATAALQPITAEMDIIENTQYHSLLLAFKGERELETLDPRTSTEEGVSWATVGYGVANGYLQRGDREQAEELLRAIVDDETWAAFGHIAAESDLADPSRF